MHGTTLSHAMVAAPKSAHAGVRPFDEGGGKSPVPGPGPIGCQRVGR